MKKLFLWIVLAVLTCGGLAAAWYQGHLGPLLASYPERQELPTIRPNKNPVILAHRGDELFAPENTLPAIQSAIDKGYEFTEMDIRLTADGVPVLMHDDTIERTTNGSGPLAELSYAELRSLDAGAWFAPEYAGTQVPSLEEALNLARGNICVMADIKGLLNRRVITLLKDFAAVAGRNCLFVSLTTLGDANPFRDMEMADAVREKLEENVRMLEKLTASQHLVFARYWPGFPQARTHRGGETVPDLIRDYPGMVALSIQSGNVTPELIDAAHENGVFTFLRVVSDKDEVYRTVLDAGIDGIFETNIPNLQRFLDVYQSE